MSGEIGPYEAKPTDGVFYLSGWYGAGSALEALQQDAPDMFDRVRQHAFTWPPLHYLLTNISASISTADPVLMDAYAALVEDVSVRERVQGRILNEYARTHRMLETLLGGPLEERQPHSHRLLVLRHEGLRALHRQQIDLLRRWRTLRHRGDEDAAEAMLLKVLLLVNAIASGLRTTG